jgi:Acetyltransferase (GNAT) domain
MMQFSNLARVCQREKITVHWTDNSRAIDDALGQLPASRDWPGLFELLLDRRGPANRVALVSDRHGPVGVVHLRPTEYGSWEPVTQWIVPGFLFPVRAGYTFDVLSALQRRVDVSWWRYPETLPASPRIENAREKVKYCISCTDDFDEYWKKSGNLSFVRQARKRCKDLAVRLNPEGGAEWIIRGADQKWREKSGIPSPAIEDRVAAANFLERIGLYKSFVLYDAETPVAGAAWLVHHNCAVGQTTYRRPEYDRYGAGTYTVEAGFRWARQSGLQEVDMGGGYAYKCLWAPAGGYTHKFTVVPTTDLWKGRALSVAGRVAKGAVRCLMGLTFQSQNTQRGADAR